MKKWIALTITGTALMTFAAPMGVEDEPAFAWERAEKLLHFHDQAQTQGRPCVFEMDLPPEGPMRDCGELEDSFASLSASSASSGAMRVDDGPTPGVRCRGASDPETDLQGRVSSADVTTGRAERGYRCNTELRGRFGARTDGGSGGYKVFRYRDGNKNECAYYDTTLLYPANGQSGDLPGVFVLDMKDPEHPVRTTALVTPAMQSPHESFSFNKKKGLLAAALANPTTSPATVDIYSVKDDCRYPRLLSSTPTGFFGHEASFSPDGETFWVSSDGNLTGSLTAIDVSNPADPKPLLTMHGVSIHGMSISDDGNRLYASSYAVDRVSTNDYGTEPVGLTTYDVSQVQARKLNPQIAVVSRFRWDPMSVPQSSVPVTIGGHPYLVEFDEYRAGDVDDPDAIGAARIIDISDEAHPQLVSNIRLEVHQTENFHPDGADISKDPGASDAFRGYAAHYCAVPSRHEPGIVACSMILSGLRVFDIRDPRHPREIAYFNSPVSTQLAGTSSFAMSAPAFAPDRGEIWYSDGNSGFYNVHLTDGVWPFTSGS